MDLKNLTIKKFHELLKNRELSCCELTAYYLENIKKQNIEINAYLEVFEKDAMAQAEAEDERLAEGGELKPLSGVPLAIKDNILIKGKIASLASKILESYQASYDATVIKKLREAGAIFLGRTNMDEFAMGGSTENSAFGVTKNPHDLERVAGGSSGGSAAALAMDGCLAALGSDTGGSIREPAAFCGVVGLKPTYGAVSRYGLTAMASSLDQIGPFAKTVEDAEIIFDVIRGRDEMDSTTTKVESEKLKVESKGKIRIGILKYDRKGVDEEINKVIDKAAAFFREQGHTVEEVEIPYIEYSLACYYITMFAEASSNLARFDGVRYGLSARLASLGKEISLLEEYMQTRAQGFGKEVKRRIMLGAYVLSAGYYDEYYGKAQKVRQAIRDSYKKVFEKFDAILSPTAPMTAFKIGEKANDPLQMYLADIFTVSQNLAGLPAISLPAGSSKVNLSRLAQPDGTKAGLPLAVQITAPWHCEDLLFKLGKQYEASASTIY